MGGRLPCVTSQAIVALYLKRVGRREIEERLGVNRNQVVGAIYRWRKQAEAQNVPIKFEPLGPMRLGAMRAGDIYDQARQEYRDMVINWPKGDQRTAEDFGLPVERVRIWRAQARVSA
jgi:hypothetical protein